MIKDKVMAPIPASLAKKKNEKNGSDFESGQEISSIEKTGDFTEEKEQQS